MIKTQNKILAIVGLAGSGKTEAVRIAKNSGRFPTHIYFPEIVFEELQKRNMSISEANERIIREELRKEHGMAVMAKLNLEKIKKGIEIGNVLIESMYSMEEYELLKKEFGDDFYVLAVYTSQKTRMERLANRPERPLSKVEVESRDISQINNLHQAGPIALADFTVQNEGTMAELKEKVGNTIDSLIG